MPDTFSDKPWRYDGFGCVHCGHHVVLQLPPDLADKVSPEELVAIGKLAAAAPQMLKALLAVIDNRQEMWGPIVFEAICVAREQHAQEKT